MSAVSEQHPPAGWYWDAQSHEERYWDGSEWTDHYSGNGPGNSATTIANAGHGPRDSACSEFPEVGEHLPPPPRRPHRGNGEVAFTRPQGAPPGWYPVLDGRSVQRWWTGYDWSGPEYPIQVGPTSQQQQMMVVNTDRGPRISETERRTSHVFHLIMTIVTFGLWLPVWGVVWLINKANKEQVRHY